MLPLGHGGPHRRIEEALLTVQAFTSMLFLLKMWRAGKAGPLLTVLLLPTAHQRHHLRAASSGMGTMAQV